MICVMSIAPVVQIIYIYSHMCTSMLSLLRGGHWGGERYVERLAHRIVIRAKGGHKIRALEAKRWYARLTRVG